MSSQYPLWTQDQAIAYEAALEAINDVIAGYSEQIHAASQSGNAADLHRIEWLNMRIDQTVAIRHSLRVTDDENVKQVRQELSAIVRAREAAYAEALAA